MMLAPYLPAKSIHYHPAFIKKGGADFNGDGQTDVVSVVYSTHHIPGFPPAIEEQFQSRHAVSLRINKGIERKQTFEEIDAPLNQLTNVSQYDVDDFVDWPARQTSMVTDSLI